MFPSPFWLKEVFAASSPMSSPLADDICSRYGLVLGTQAHVGPAMQRQMNLSGQVRAMLQSLTPELWLVARLDDFGSQVQLSFFVICAAFAPIAAPLRTREKTCPGLSYLSAAKFQVSGGTPVAHCTVLMRQTRKQVVLSFLEKDRTRRVRALSLGRFLLGVAMRALEPFSSSDAVMLCVAEDDGSGRLVAYYQSMGMSVDLIKTKKSKASTPMFGHVKAIRAFSERADYCRMQNVLLRCLGKSVGANAQLLASRPIPTPSRALLSDPCDRGAKVHRFMTHGSDESGTR